MNNNFKSKYTIIIILLFIVSVNIYGQRGRKGPRGQMNDKNMIVGKVIDQSSQSPLEFATVSIFSAEDVLLNGGITDVDGKFRLEVDPVEDMKAVIEFIGYESKTLENLNFEEGKKMLRLGTIEVSQGGIALDAVEVVAEKSEMQFSLDKRVFNVGKDLSSRGGSASDLLSNIPSVSVGVEGEVSLRGSENVRILINGRPSGLIGINGTDGLRTIQASQIEKVEIITNPSSKFEAEGMAGIINIILKKETGSGFNGSFEVTGGLPETYGVGANLNYRKNKLNWFVNYNFNRRTGDATGDAYREFYGDDFTAISLVNTLRKRGGNNHSFQFGSDYIISDKETLTGAFLYRYGKDENDNRVIYRDTTVSPGSFEGRFLGSDINTYLLRTDDEIEKEPTLEYSLRYDKKIAKDHSLQADISYQSNTESESSLFQESLYRNDIVINDDVLQQRSANDEGQNQFRVQLDYKRPIGNDFKTESGLLGTFRKIQNDFLVETFLDDEWQNEVGLSNNFIYNEDVIGAYASVGKDFEKISFQVGLRAEYSKIKTELLQTNEVNDNDYTNLFPSAFLSYKLKNNNSFQVSYSRRIRRPRFWDLNPFFTFTDPRNFFSGNPKLKPEYTDSYELGYLKYWTSANLGVTTYYRHTTDNITRIQTQNVNDQTTLRKPENIGTEDNMGLEIIFGYTGIDWLRLDGSLNAFRFVTEGTTEDGMDLSVDNFAWTSNINSMIKFWKNADLQLRLNYRAPRKTIQGERKSITSVNIGLSKDLTPDLTFTFSIRDLFNNRRRRSIIENENIFEESDFQWRPRTFIATINYRINRKKERSRNRPESEGEF